MVEKRENLKLVNVEYENEGKKAVLTFLDEERKEIRTVNFNKQVYDNGKYIDSDEKNEKVESWSQECFGVTFKDLPSKVGTRKTVYCYENFNSLFEIEQVEKFTADMKDQIFQTECRDVILDDNGIRIRYMIDGKVYESKMTWATYMPETKQWFTDPQKKTKQIKKFEDKFGIPIMRKDELIGHPLMVECKIAMGKYYYGDIKKFPKKG